MQEKEHDKALGGFLTHVDGTSIDALKSRKIPSNNTTGVKGVYLVKGRYLAKSYSSIGNIFLEHTLRLKKRLKPVKKRKKL